MNILLEDFNAKVGREYIYKPTLGNVSLHKINSDNGVRVLNFAISKKCDSRVQCSHIITFINTLGLILMGKHTSRLTTSWLIKGGIQIQLMFGFSEDLTTILLSGGCKS
jgi:hypothetical protein